jgi:hypothetical protein
MRAYGLALGACLSFAAFAAMAQTPPASAPTGSATTAPASASLEHNPPPTLEAVAIAPLACGGATSWTEAKAIASTGRAIRAGSRLTVAGMTFTDTRARDGRPGAAYSYVGVFGDSGLDLVQVARGESSSYLLIDARKHSRAELDRFPVPSPRSRYFAVASPAGRGTPGGIAVVERTPDGLKSVISIPRTDLVDDPCRLTNLTWLSDDRFMVRVARSGTSGSNSPGIAVTYRLTEGKWKPGT